jgi:hypothetical protein
MSIAFVFIAKRIKHLATKIKLQVAKDIIRQQEVIFLNIARCLYLRQRIKLVQNMIFFTEIAFF